MLCSTTNLRKSISKVPSNVKENLSLKVFEYKNKQRRKPLLHTRFNPKLEMSILLSLQLSFFKVSYQVSIQKALFLTLGVSTVETNRDRDRDRPSCRD
jgi:hypothetical protein